MMETVITTHEKSLRNWDDEQISIKKRIHSRFISFLIIKILSKNFKIIINNTNVKLNSTQKLLVKILKRMNSTIIRLTMKQKMN